MHQSRVLFLSLTLAASITGCNSVGRVEVSRTDDAPTTAVPIHTAKRHGPPAHAKAWGFRAKHNYRYFPEAEVYYAPDRDTYFWMEDGTWRASLMLPDRIRVTLHSPVSVALDTAEPWEAHGQVLAQLEAKEAARKARGLKPKHEEPGTLDFRGAFVSE